MRDVLPPESARRRRFVDIFAEVAGDAGYGEVITPLLEDYGVFARVGDATDLVQKEMYRFTDNGGRDVALRPEFTAAVCRAFVEHRPATPWKVWCAGPLLRYERPQRGRYRQFDQVNLEVLGQHRPDGRRRGDRPRLAVLRAARSAQGDSARQLARHAGGTSPRTSRCCAATSPTTSPSCPTRAWRRSLATRCVCSTRSGPRTPS